MREYLHTTNHLEAPYFAAEKSNDYSIQVAENLWIHKDYHNVLYKAIEDSPLREKKNMSTQICRTICIHKSFLV
jgi:hypothetical protein